MQGSYIGITPASQAGQAGSTPVPCSKKEHELVRSGKLVFFFSAMRSAYPLQAEREGGSLCPVRKVRWRST